MMYMGTGAGTGALKCCGVGFSKFVVLVELQKVFCGIFPGEVHMYDGHVVLYICFCLCCVNMEILSASNFRSIITGFTRGRKKYGDLENLVGDKI